VLWDNPEGWGGERGGRRGVRLEGGTGAHVHPWLIHVDAWQKPPQYCKVIILQFKKKKKRNSRRLGGGGYFAKMWQNFHQS